MQRERETEKANDRKIEVAAKRELLNSSKIDPNFQYYCFISVTQSDSFSENQALDGVLLKLLLLVVKPLLVKYLHLCEFVYLCHLCS